MNDVGLRALQQVIQIQSVDVNREIIDAGIINVCQTLLMYGERPLPPEAHIIVHVHPWQDEQIQYEKHQYLYTLFGQAIVHELTGKVR